MNCHKLSKMTIGNSHIVSVEQYEKDVAMVRGLLDIYTFREVANICGVSYGCVFNFIGNARPYNGMVRYYSKTIQMIDAIRDMLGLCENGKIVGGELPYVPDHCWHYDINDDPMFVT